MTSVRVPPMTVQQTSYSPRYRGEWHEHHKAQLIYPRRGTMTMHTKAGTWVVPPLRACWLPPLERHCVEVAGRLEMHSVYCSAAMLELLPDRAGLVEVSALMRELIRALHEAPAVELTTERASRMASVLVDQINLRRSPQLIDPPLHSQRLKRIGDALATHPGDQRTLQDWSEELGVSTRTLARLFEKETQLTFAGYRQQVRLQAAVGKLARGEMVSAIAYDLGFSSTSNFIAMFRKATGTTPKQYLKRECQSA